MSAPSEFPRRDTRPGAPLLRVTSTTIPGSAAIIHVHGDVDQDTRRALDEALAKAIVDRPPLLVVDLAGLGFCYSVCLNALLSARRDANAAGTRMALAAVTPQALRVLKLTETDRLFTLHDSVHAALDGESDRPTG
ncbi:MULTISPECIES: STAS domain-containing protein [Kitasatospora]|uniref:STAS domain-containing protein n=1 Tax=Kitasatospora TaxID=2063 RepID=UPI000A83F611|nr:MULTISPECIES: STAS domain-containing protein [Kitasatospora]